MLMRLPCMNALKGRTHAHLAKEAKPNQTSDSSLTLGNHNSSRTFQRLLRERAKGQ